MGLQEQRHWSDRPLTVCGIIRDKLISLNDELGSDERQRLWPYARKSLYTETEDKYILATRKRLLHEAADVYDDTNDLDAYLVAFDKAIALHKGGPK